MYLFSIPDSNGVRLLNCILFTAISDHKEWFYDDFKLDVAYGCPQCCIWNGGRIEPGDGVQDSEEKIKSIFKLYNKYEVKYRLNFTNYLLKEEHLHDEYGNKIATEAQKIGNNLVTVSTPFMAKYMTSKYPKLPITWSTIINYGNTDEERLEKVNLLSKDNIVVIPYQLNNKDIIQKILYPDNIEIIASEQCVSNCRIRTKHRNITNCVNLGLLPPEAEREFMKNTCLSKVGKNEDLMFYSIISRKSLKKYASLGFYRFKLLDRGAVMTTLANYVVYLVLPECESQFIKYIEDFLREFNNIKHTSFTIDKEAYLRNLNFLRKYEI